MASDTRRSGLRPETAAPTSTSSRRSPVAWRRRPRPSRADSDSLADACEPLSDASSMAPPSTGCARTATSSSRASAAASSASPPGGRTIAAARSGSASSTARVARHAQAHGRLPPRDRGLPLPRSRPAPHAHGVPPARRHERSAAAAEICVQRLVSAAARRELALTAPHGSMRSSAA